MVQVIYGITYQRDNCGRTIEGAAPLKSFIDGTESDVPPDYRCVYSGQQLVTRSDQPNVIRPFNFPIPAAENFIQAWSMFDAARDAEIARQQKAAAGQAMAQEAAMAGIQTGGLVLPPSFTEGPANTEMKIARAINGDGDNMALW